jgi:hypothetical protein
MRNSLVSGVIRHPIRTRFLSADNGLRPVFFRTFTGTGGAMFVASSTS